jgi:hypothetical protein
MPALAPVEVQDRGAIRTRHGARGRGALVAKTLVSRGIERVGAPTIAGALAVSASLVHTWGNPDVDRHDITLRDVLAGPEPFAREVLAGAVAHLDAQVEVLDGMPLVERLFDLCLLAGEALRLHGLGWADIRDVPTDVLKKLVGILDKMAGGCRQAAADIRRELGRRGAA